MTNSEQLQANNERIEEITRLVKTKTAGSGGIFSEDVAVYEMNQKCLDLITSGKFLKVEMKVNQAINGDVYTSVHENNATTITKTYKQVIAQGEKFVLANASTDGRNVNFDCVSLYNHITFRFQSSGKFVMFINQLEITDTAVKHTYTWTDLTPYTQSPGAEFKVYYTA